MKRKAILFDLFGTLCGATSPEWQIIKKWNLSPEKYNGLQRVVCGTKFNGDYDEYYSLILKEAKLNNNEENKKILRKIYNSELEKAIIYPETKEILEELKREEYKIGLISNAYPPTRENVLEKRDLIHYFDTIFLSYEIGMTKQNPEYYNMCLKKLKVSPENAIMVGDTLRSDIIISKQATSNKILGILISKEKQEKIGIDKLIIVPSLVYVPEAVEKYFSNPMIK